MDMGQLGAFINQIGFPIAVSLFTLIRLESTVKENTKTVDALKSVISNMSTILEIVRKDKEEE